MTAEVPGMHRREPYSPVRHGTQLNAASQIRPTSLNEDMIDVKSKKSQSRRSPNKSGLSINDEKESRLTGKDSGKRWSVYNWQKASENLQYDAKVTRDTSGNAIIFGRLAANPISQTKAMFSQENIHRTNLAITKAKSTYNNG